MTLSAWQRVFASFDSERKVSRAGSALSLELMHAELPASRAVAVLPATSATFCVLAACP